MSHTARWEKAGYGERWGSFKLMVDEIESSPEGHLVEVTVRNNDEEVSVRVLVAPGYYGAMIPWLAARMVTFDLGATKFDRFRHVQNVLFGPDIRVPDPQAYLEALDSVPTLSAQASDLPDHFYRGLEVQLDEGNVEDHDPGDVSFASLHNAHRLIHDQGLPEAVEFMRNVKDHGIVAGRWPRERVHYFKGFDWMTSAGKNALGIFLQMLNLKKPLDFKDIRPKRYPRNEGPKEWSPHDLQSFILIKGRDYGRPQS